MAAGSAPTAGLPRHGPWWRRIPRSLAGLVVVVLLVGAYAATYAAGGSRTALPHLFYVPILVAALPFGIWGAVVVALVASVVAGPLLPLDVAADEAQQVGNWLSRGVAFVVIGALAGWSLRAVRTAYAYDVARWFEAELDRATPALGTGDDPVRIRRVIAERRLEVVFQPVYSLRDGRLVAAEALARFPDDPGRSPDLWFAEAARLGVGVDLELAAVAAVLEASTGLPPGVAVAVNTSPSTLTDPRFVDLVHGRDDRPVIVEVTEHAVVDDYATLAAVAADLREEGVRIAVDDAGAGFSSLRHIVRLGPDVIKLDTGLTQGLATDPVRRAMATSLLRFAHETGSEMVAEGIETRADLVTWLDLGADAGQGHLLGRPGPLPVAEQSDLVARLTARAHRGPGSSGRR